jgi:hypothetical protein
MKTISTRYLLPLAAIALLASACDPFPAKPGGDPRIVRIIATDQDWTSHSVTIENTGAAGTIVNDQAYPLDRIFVQFNKPMNGLTLQKYPNYDANGVKTDPTTLPTADQATGLCTKPDNLTSTFPANTTYCYQPSSVGDGGSLVVGAVTDANDNRDAWIVAGTTYTITGTVKDYEGKSLAINVSVSVDPLPFTSTTDTIRAPALGRSYSYGFRANWFPDGGVANAGGYEVAYAKDSTGSAPAEADAAWKTPTGAGAAISCGQSNYPTSPATLLGAIVCQVAIGELDPETDYWFRWRPTGGTWVVSGAPQTTRVPMAVTLTNFSDPTVVPPVISTGAVQVAWGRTLGDTNTAAPAFPTVAGDRAVIVERITDDGTATEPSPTAAGWAPVTLEYIADVVNGGNLFRTGVDKTTTSGTGYWYRVRPDYVSGKIFVGTAGHKVSH